MKLEMSITPDYVSHWDTSAALREFLQNALDAQRDGHLLEISSDEEWVHLMSYGATLPLKTLLLGASTKSNNAEMIGQFGEGYKLGCLVLARQGFEMKISSDQGTMIPLIEYSKAYQTDVLKFEVDHDLICHEGVRISFRHPITEVWLKSQILLDDPFTPRILKDKPGMVYLNGLRLGLEPTQKSEDHWHWGYNLPPGLELDRDRRMTSLSSLESSIINVIEGSGSIEDLYTALKGPIPEFAGVIYHQISYEHREGIHNLFKEMHGEKAFGIKTMTSTDDKGVIRSGGFIPVTISAKGLVGVINYVQPSFQKVIELSNDNIGSYERVELVKDQIDVQNQIFDILLSKELKGTRLERIGDHEIIPVVFKDPDARALFEGAEGKIYVSIKAYSTRGELLETLIHEHVHQSISGHGRDFLNVFEEDVSTVLNTLINKFHSNKEGL